MSRVEILVATGLVLLLGVLMLMGVVDARRRARDGAIVSSVRQAQASVETYRAKNASYPAAASDLPSGEAELVDAFGYLPEPEGCAADLAQTCRSYVLKFVLEGRVGTLIGGNCELRPGSGITCAR